MIPGDIRSHLERYLDLRRALGFNMDCRGSRLRDFVAFVEAHDLSGFGMAQGALDWACSSIRLCGPAGRAQRLSWARQLLSHLHAIDPEIQVPAAGLLPRVVRAKPHIYSDTEISLLINGAQSLGPRGSLRPHSYATFIGLLASSGLRPNEALRLRMSEVKLEADPPLLYVMQTKFRKSRIVPLHPSTAQPLNAYAQQRRRQGGERCDRFFISRRGGAVTYEAASQTFLHLARRLGIRGPVGRGASLHGLRHTFAVRRLTAWYREGLDVRARLPELSVYLGHVRPEDTYCYLTATPELLGAAALRFESYAAQGNGQ
jgi:integrase/recombinase XerD